MTKRPKTKGFQKLGLAVQSKAIVFWLWKMQLIGRSLLCYTNQPLKYISRNEFKQKCYWHHVTHKLRHCAQVVNVDKSHLLNWAEGGYFLWEVISSLRNCFRWVLSSQTQTLKQKTFTFLSVVQLLHEIVYSDWLTSISYRYIQTMKN